MHNVMLQTWHLKSTNTGNKNDQKCRFVKKFIMNNVNMTNETPHYIIKNTEILYNNGQIQTENNRWSVEQETKQKIITSQLKKTSN